MHRKRFASLLIVALMLVPVVAGILVYAIYVMSMARTGREGMSSGANQTVSFVVPFRVGDYVALLIELKALGNGTETYIGNTTLAMIIEEIGWPFTKVRLVDANTTTEIPTYLLASPPENFSAPFYVSLFREYICLPFAYAGSSKNTIIFEASSPESCASIRVDLYYSYNNVFQSGTIIYGIGGSAYIEHYELVASARTGETRVVINSSNSLCRGYLSTDIRYTAPGAYIYTGDNQFIYSYSYDEALSAPELLMIAKNPSNQELWSAVINGKYRGWVLVVSPLLREFWNLPHLDDLNNYGAVLVRGNITIPANVQTLSQISNS